jgi:chlorobactene glucosyltransferase
MASAWESCSILERSSMARAKSAGGLACPIPGTMLPYRHPGHKKSLPARIDRNKLRPYIGIVCLCIVSLCIAGAERRRGHDAMTLFPQLEGWVRLMFLIGAGYFLLLSISNVVWLRLSSREPRLRRGRKVSVLVPARNEERNIRLCIDSLLDQTYANYEIVVLDDQSTDGTWEIISQYQERLPGRVRAVRGEPLPREGWLGKPHAMQQLARHASGEYLMFTDADTVHGTESIAWAVTNLESHRADCVSGYVYQEMNTLGEQFIVPATYIMSAMLLPLWLITALPTPGLSFAIGQLLIFRRSAFEAIGGYSRVRGQISDDLAIPCSA